MVVNERGEIEFVNALALSMFGFEREELIGEPVEQLVPERYRIAHPDFRARYFADPRMRPLGTAAELSARRKDGSEFPVEITLSHVRTEDGLLVSSAIREITERRRAEEAIARLAAIVESSNDAIISKSLQGQITSWNDAAERTYGYSAAEAVGKHISMLLPPEREDELNELLVRVGAGERISHLESTRLRKDGQIIDVSVTISPIKDANGHVVGSSTVARDITEHKRAERERVELLEAGARAESANRAKSEFLARMSHELRTPLNAIIGFTQLVELDGLTPLQSEHTGYVLKAAGHLLELIDEVLQLTTIETDHVTISPEPVPLSDTVSEALALLGPQAREHGVALYTSPEGLAHDQHVRADRQRLKQVLLNVLSNAIKYNRPGGRVHVSFAFTEGGRVRTMIADTGIGIAPEQLAKLFEPFERLGAEYTDVEGTGLGLALSKRLIEALEGSIEISSEHGIGTVVTLQLAAASAPAAKHQLGPSDRELPSLGDEAGGRHVILYIEDNLSNLTLVERILERYRAVELLPAMQGRLGLELAREHRPNLIVLDLHLPDIQGGEVLKRLKADEPTREIPVVMLTADASAKQAEHFKTLGAADYLTKPLDVSEFLETVARNLDARRADGHS